jgi:outer membrane protein TolC
MKDQEANLCIKLGGIMSTHLYTHGQTDYLEVLLAQCAQYASDEALIQSTRTVSTNIVALYKALGGGWEYLMKSNLF